MEPSPAALESSYRVIFKAERLGGCYTCWHFGYRLEPAVWCAHPNGEHLRSQAERVCAFWEREPGSDDEVANG